MDIIFLQFMSLIDFNSSLKLPSLSLSGLRLLSLQKLDLESLRIGFFTLVDLILLADASAFVNFLFFCCV